MRLRRVWYRSAAQIAASEGVVFVLSPKSRRFIYVAAYAENLELVSRDAKTATRYAKMTVASPGRTRIAAARRAASAHARREFVRTKVGDSTVAGSWRYVRLFLC